MTLSDDQMKGLASHLGYGNTAASLWFVGTEEGLGGATDARENEVNLKARCRWTAVMDMAEAHLTLVEAGQPIDISRPRAGHIGVWQWMAKIARAFEGNEDFCDTAKANVFVRATDGLGRVSGTTFLTELRPFPSATANGALSFEHALEPDKLNALLARRTERQLEFLDAGHTKCVICYGGSSRAAFGTHFGVQWKALTPFDWTSSKGKPRTTTVYTAQRRNGPRISAELFMLPFLGNGALCEDVLRQFVASEAFQSSRKLTLNQNAERVPPP